MVSDVLLITRSYVISLLSRLCYAAEYAHRPNYISENVIYRRLFPRYVTVQKLESEIV